VSFLLLALAGSCGSDHLQASQREALYRHMQVHEAELARAQAHTSGADATSLADGAPRERCVAEGAAARAICEASQAVCSLGQRLDERDASLRCLRASDACTAAHARLAAREHGRASCATHAP
jgi:hypothetical protein